MVDVLKSRFDVRLGWWSGLSIPKEKRLLRAHMLAIRTALSDAQKQQQAALVCEHIIELLVEYAHLRNRQSLTILSYMALPTEVDLSAVAHWAWQAGHNLCLPRVQEASEGLLSLHSYTAYTRLVGNRWGILEPQNHPLPHALWQRIDVVLVPGVAFTRSGQRLGFGGGFYDRLCRQLPQALLVAAAFTEQLIDGVPVEEHDVRMHVVCHSKQRIDCRD